MDASSETRIAVATSDVDAPAEVVFALVADPARHADWDGNGNVASAAAGQRPRAVGDVFVAMLTQGSVRENHVVELEEGRRIAWRPAEPGQPPVGHLWRWEVEPLGPGRCRVTHTYDWTEMHDPGRLEKARSTTTDRLMASLRRLAAVARDEG